MIERAVPNTPGDGIGLRLLTLTWLCDFGSECFKVTVCLAESVLALKLGSQGNLQEFGCRKSAPLQFLVEIIWQVHLDSRHTPNYTHITLGYPVDDHPGSPLKRTRISLDELVVRDRWQ